MTQENKTSRKRILTLDIIRGLFLIIILADHLAWSPSLLFQFSTAYTGEISSAAEGFFVISGILVGYIYGPKLKIDFKSTLKKIWRRSLLLYVLSISLTIIYTLWAISLPGGYPRTSTALPENVFNFLFGTLSLSYTFGWADFLSRYAVFMFLAPFALYLIVIRKALLLIGISFIVWLTSGLFGSWLIYASWQFIFIPSIIIGYYLTNIELFIKQKKWMYTAITSAGIATYTLAFVVIALPPLILVNYSDLVDGKVAEILNHINAIRIQILPYFDKASVSIARIIVGVVWFFSLYLVIRKYESKIHEKTLGILYLFGKYSLFVYVFQSLLIFVIDIILPAEGSFHNNILFNTFISIFALGIVLIATLLYDHRHKVVRIITNKETK